MVTSRQLYNEVDILIAVTQHPLPRRATYNIVMRYYIPERPLRVIIYLEYKIGFPGYSNKKEVVFGVGRFFSSFS